MDNQKMQKYAGAEETSTKEAIDKLLSTIREKIQEKIDTDSAGTDRS